MPGRQESIDTNTQTELLRTVLELAAGNTKSLTSLEDIKQDIEELRKTVETEIRELRHAVNGNGRRGLKEEVEILKTRVLIIWAGGGFVIAGLIGLWLNGIT